MLSNFVPTDLSRPISINGRTVDKKLAFPMHQLAESKHAEGITVIGIQNVPTGLFSNGGNKFSFTLTRGASVQRIKSVWIKIDVKVVNATSTLVPVTHFFRQIDVRHSADPNIIRSYYDDATAFSLYSFMSDEKLRSASKLLNIDQRFSSIFGLASPISTNQTRSFYLPLIGNVFENLDVNWNNAKADLQFDFFPATEGIVASPSNSAANVECLGMSLIVEQPINDEGMKLVQDSIESKFTKVVNYLDPVYITTYKNKLLTTSTSNKLDLSIINGNVSHMMIMIRPTGSSNVGWTNGHCLNIGDEAGALIDIHNDSGKTIFNHAYPTKFLRCGIVSSQMESEAPTRDPFYVIPFCKNVVSSLQGTFNGSYYFTTNTKHFLEIIPQPGVAEVQTFTCSAAPGDGNYRFFLDGEFSIPLAYNANAATMKAAFEDLTFCKRRGITITFSGALDNAVTATITNPNGNGLEQRLIQVIGNNLNNAGTEIAVTTALTTSGYAGLSTGNYDIDIYVWYQKRAYWLNKVVCELA